MFCPTQRTELFCLFSCKFDATQEIIHKHLRQ